MVVQRRARGPGDRRAPGARSCAASGTRWTSRSPTSRPTCARRRRRPPRSSSCPDRVEAAASLRARRARLDGLAGGSLAAAARDLAAERRLLDRLDPAVPPRRVARARGPPARPGDACGAGPRRAARAVERGARSSGRQHALARGPCRAGARRPRRERDGPGRARPAGDPRARLRDRRGARADGGIVRAPSDAPAGTGLRVTLAGGDIGATVDDRARLTGRAGRDPTYPSRR